MLSAQTGAKAPSLAGHLGEPWPLEGTHPSPWPNYLQAQRRLCFTSTRSQQSLVRRILGSCALERAVLLHRAGMQFLRAAPYNLQYRGEMSETDEKRHVLWPSAQTPACQLQGDFIAQERPEVGEQQGSGALL